MHTVQLFPFLQWVFEWSYVQHPDIIPITFAITFIFVAVIVDAIVCVIIQFIGSGLNVSLFVGDDAYDGICWFFPIFLNLFIIIIVHTMRHNRHTWLQQ